MLGGLTSREPILTSSFCLLRALELCRAWVTRKLTSGYLQWQPPGTRVTTTVAGIGGAVQADTFHDSPVTQAHPCHCTCLQLRVGGEHLPPSDGDDSGVHKT